MPSKTQVKNMNIEPLRNFLDQHFEGITEEMQKAELQQIVEDNWGDLDEVLNAPEVDRGPLATDLYSGKPDPRLLASMGQDSEEDSDDVEEE